MKVSDNFREIKFYAMSGAEFEKSPFQGVTSKEGIFLKYKIILKQNQKTKSLIAYKIIFAPICPILVIFGRVIMDIYSAAYRVTPEKTRNIQTRICTFYYI